MKQFKKRKSDARDEDLKEICNRMINENTARWKIRKLEEEKKKQEEDRIESENWERTKRLNIARYKKMKILKKIESSKKVIPSMNLERIEEKKIMWRKYRES